MVYDDHFAEGWAQIFILIGLLLTLYPFIEIAVLNAILKRTNNRYFSLGIPAILLLGGYFLTMQMDAIFVMGASLILIGPIAAIMPPYIFPDLTDQKGRFWRAVTCYIGILIVGIVLILISLPFGVFKKELFSVVPPVSNAILYGAAFIVYIVIARQIFQVLRESEDKQEKSPDKPKDVC